MKPSVFWLLVAAIILSGCGNAESSSPTSTSPASTSMAPEAGNPDNAREIVLNENGMSVGTRNLEFGSTSTADATSELARVLGEPEVTTGNCPEGDYDYEQARYEGLSLVFTEGNLSGWTAESDQFLTSGRIGLGSELGELQDTYSDLAVDEQSSIGVEWSTSALWGTLENNKVASMRAGLTCIVR